MATSPEVTCSKSTVYRHFAKGYYSAGKIDLPRAVKFKPRKESRPDYVPKGVKIGRSYEDFLAFMDENRFSDHVEMDTVIGKIGGKIILTLHFTSCNFMIGLLLDNKTASEAARRFTEFKSHLRANGVSISNLFRVVLTDNGGEFSDVFSFENDPEGHREINLFFCDPMCSSQKPFIEKNHSIFRDIVPKGSSFEGFTQETVNLIFSHVNSISRNKFCGKTPYELFAFIYGDYLPELMGIRKIASKDVVQSPKLLKGIADLSEN